MRLLNKNEYLMIAMFTVLGITGASVVLTFIGNDPATQSELIRAGIFVLVFWANYGIYSIWKTLEERVW